MKIGIVGYGNVGRGVEKAIMYNTDTSLYGIYTRRNPELIKPVTTDVPVLSVSELEKKDNGPDVLILCGGSATDLPVMTPEFAKRYSVVDSFDTHANIPSHFENVNKSALSANTTAIISAGWDPGLFSLARSYMLASVPYGETYTFWGRGVSQGHSDAIRRIPGVKDARQYTVPIEKAMDSVRNGENPKLSARQKHLRECFVVAEDGADREEITRKIVTMPNYFDEYDTTVTFITQEEMDAEHFEMPHAGNVIRSGIVDNGSHKATMEFSLSLDSNPEFTGGVLVACARAAYKLNKRGNYGAFTMLDVAPADLLPLSREDIISHLV